jgi:hypothetical protein
MSSRPRRLVGVLVAVLALYPAAALAVIYNEIPDGDLSGVPGSPTSLGSLPAGAHTVSGSFGGGDFDLVTLSLGSGKQLNSIVLDNYNGPSLSFVGLQSGSTWTEALGATINPANLMGWTHISTGLIGTNILDDIGLGAGAPGFVPPLPAGSYTFLFQETGSQTFDYSLTFNVVPEPSTILLAAFGLAGLVAWRWRKRTR